MAGTIRMAAGAVAWLALVGGALASEAVEWRGPGVNACDGRCSFAWAMEQLPEDSRALLEEAMLAQPEPLPLHVQPGMVSPMMAYFDGRAGEARMDRRGVVIATDEAAPAVGWTLSNGDVFARLDACQNPALFKRGMSAPVLPAAVDDGYGVSASALAGGSSYWHGGGSGASGGGGGGGIIVPPDDPDPFWPPIVVPPDEEPPAAIPVGTASGNLLIALLMLVSMVWGVGRLEASAKGSGWAGRE